MKRYVKTAAVLGTVGLLTFAALAQQGREDAPPGIPRERWIRVGDRFGVVLAPSWQRSPGSNETWTDSRSGTLMVKVGGRWQRLRVDAPVIVVPPADAEPKLAPAPRPVSPGPP